jgi:hypothetical protein
VREAGRPDRPIEPPPDPTAPGGRRGHLRVLPNPIAD